MRQRSSPRRRLYYLSLDATLPHWGDEKHAYSDLLLLQRDAADHWRHAGGAAPHSDGDDAGRWSSAGGCLPLAVTDFVLAGRCL